MNNTSATLYGPLFLVLLFADYRQAQTPDQWKQQPTTTCRGISTHTWPYIIPDAPSALSSSSVFSSCIRQRGSLDDFSHEAAATDVGHSGAARPRFAVLRNLRFCVFGGEGHKDGKGVLRCAVCIDEFDDDDTIRLLFKCHHVFHLECVDDRYTLRLSENTEEGRHRRRELRQSERISQSQVTLTKAMSRVSRGIGERGAIVVVGQFNSGDRIGDCHFLAFAFHQDSVLGGGSKRRRKAIKEARVERWSLSGVTSGKDLLASRGDGSKTKAPARPRPPNNTGTLLRSTGYKRHDYLLQEEYATAREGHQGSNTNAEQGHNGSNAGMWMVAASLGLGIVYASRLRELIAATVGGVQVQSRSTPAGVEGGSLASDGV
ncbi:hypothetical protein HPP92_009308 [Vanilla planifolia]|uniref:RING-type domain-containing protein n=1 Tax=Vanilla planifolia TaxID=51239 RepID=A0A835V5I1_VANPL|nr:hypothetical protein HPP92_009517 [Vanilla planifolia]KAG0487213.1 hypothetical protein HPP92_009308 [Vanilla planifolia]